LLLTGCGCVAWAKDVEPFKSKEGGYQVKFPSEVTERPLDTPAGQLHIAESEVESGTCVVAWVDLRREEKEPDSRTKERLEKAREAILDRLMANNRTNTPVKLDNHPGLSFSGHIKNGTGRVQGRVYLVKDRLYEVLVLGTEDWVAKEASGFLNSFTLLK
jgi:hypothetical protein